MPILIGQNNKAKEVSSFFIGKNGKARTPSSVFVGKNGKAKECSIGINWKFIGTKESWFSLSEYPYNRTLQIVNNKIYIPFRLEDGVYPIGTFDIKTGQFDSNYISRSLTGYGSSIFAICKDPIRDVIFFISRESNPIIDGYNISEGISFQMDYGSGSDINDLFGAVAINYEIENELAKTRIIYYGNFYASSGYTDMYIFDNAFENNDGSYRAGGIYRYKSSSSSAYNTGLLYYKNELYKLSIGDNYAIAIQKLVEPSYDVVDVIDIPSDIRIRYPIPFVFKDKIYIIPRYLGSNDNRLMISFDGEKLKEEGEIPYAGTDYDDMVFSVATDDKHIHLLRTSSYVSNYVNYYIGG